MGTLFDALIGWSIRQRAVVLIVAAALVAIGLRTLASARTDVLPELTPPRVVVQTDVPGMATLDVEELVTRPLERVLLGTAEMTAVRSSSTPGLSVVTVHFADGVDVYRARQLVSERVDAARPRLPQGAKPPQLAPISAPIGAIMKLAVTSAAGGTAPGDREARAFADWTLRPRLLAVQGVSQVTVLGGSVERLEVRPDVVRMRALGVGLANITKAVAESQSLVGAGFVEVGEQRIDVRNDTRLPWDEAPERLADATVESSRGALVRLRDVADIVRADEPPVGGALYDGRPAVFVQVNKLPSADTLRVTRDVEHALEALRSQAPLAVVIEPPVFRQATFIRTSIAGVVRAMLVGGVLVVAVLFAFLRVPRLALISLVAIPLSVLAAAASLVAFGLTINGMVLGGLAIAVGEVVDDAIVDVENVWRRLQENAEAEAPREPLDVVRDASREVRGSVVYATVIVCVVLVPVLTLGGIAGRIFAPLAIAYILAILASLVVALTVTPALCATLLPQIASRGAGKPAIAEALVTRYRRLLAWVAARPKLVLVPSAVLMVLACVALPFLGGRFLPELHERGLVAHVLSAPGTSLGTTLRLGAAVDTKLRPDVALHVAVRAGRSELDEDAAPVHRMEIDVVLRDAGDREWDQLTADVAKRIGAVPGVGFVVEGFLTERIHELLSGETAPVVVKVIGPDLATLRRLAAEVAVEMDRTVGLGHVQVEPQIDVPQLRIRPDPTSLAKSGLTATDLTTTVVGLRQGRVATQLLGPDGRTMDVVVAGQERLGGIEASFAITSGVGAIHGGARYSVCVAPHARAVMSPTTEATSTGKSESTEKFPTVGTSSANTTPANGVPKTEPNPPAIPARRSLRRTSPRAPIASPTISAKLAPICTAVPSRPALPPKRCVSNVPASTSGAIRFGTRLLSSKVASITRSMPPREGLPMRSYTKPISAPATGSRNTTLWFCPRALVTVESSARNSAEAAPVSAPTSVAPTVTRARSRRRSERTDSMGDLGGSSSRELGSPRPRVLRRASFSRRRHVGVIGGTGRGCRRTPPPSCVLPILSRTECVSSGGVSADWTQNHGLP